MARLHQWLKSRKCIRSLFQLTRVRSRSSQSDSAPYHWGETIGVLSLGLINGPTVASYRPHLNITGTISELGSDNKRSSYRETCDGKSIFCLTEWKSKKLMKCRNVMHFQ